MVLFLARSFYPGLNMGCRSWLSKYFSGTVLCLLQDYLQNNQHWPIPHEKGTQESMLKKKGGGECLGFFWFGVFVGCGFLLLLLFQFLQSLGACFFGFSFFFFFREKNLQLKQLTISTPSKAFLRYFKSTKKQESHYKELGILEQSVRGDLQTVAVLLGTSSSYALQIIYVRETPL